MAVYLGEKDAKRLAARAYLKAAAVVTTPEAKAGYERLARAALHLQTRDAFSTTELTPGELEAQFRTEQADADRWYADLKAKETGWIADGADPEAEFDRLYTEEPAIDDDEPFEELRRRAFDPAYVVPSVVVTVIVLGLTTLVWWFARRARRA
jgi:hypothetical protein